MKKLTALILATAFVFTACAPIERAKLKINTIDYPCFNYPDAEWGITKDDLFKNLGKTADDFETETNDDKINPDEKLKTQVDFLGEECDAVFEFIGIPDSEYMPLQIVTVVYPLNGKGFDEFKAEIEDTLKKQNNQYVVSESKAPFGNITATCAFTDEKQITDLTNSVREGYNNYIYHLYDTGFVSAADESDKIRRMSIDYSFTLNKPLSSVTLVYFSDSDMCRVVFDGTGIVQPLGYATAYSRLKK